MQGVHDSWQDAVPSRSSPLLQRRSLGVFLTKLLHPSGCSASAVSHVSLVAASTVCFLVSSSAKTFAKCPRLPHLLQVLSSCLQCGFCMSVDVLPRQECSHAQLTVVELSRNQAVRGSTRILAVAAESLNRLCEANTIAMLPRYHNGI